MAPSPREIRPPVAAGRFYEADPSRCADDAASLVVDPGEHHDLPQRIVGAVAPHAGWVCSGRIAGETFAAMRGRCDARTFVMTGSVHTIDLARPAVDAADAWSTPLGEVEVDTELRDALAELDCVDRIDEAHTREHALEVLLPLMQTAFGDDFRIVPIMIPPRQVAPEWGRSIGELLADWPEPVAMICSIDLTHYGPNYRFTPHGVGPDGHRWAHEDNDARIIDRVTRLADDEIVCEASSHMNTCGGGAAAATCAAVRCLGASRGVLIEHSDSATELARIRHADRTNSVGYAGIVFG